MTNENLKNKKVKIPLSFLLISATDILQEMDVVSDLFLFLLRYSFLLEEASNPQNSCDPKISQFSAPQGNGEMGTRYLDPKYSRWISVDPALGEYIPQAPVSDEARKHNQNLPGMGGIYNHINGDLYAYTANNPVRYVDPDGMEIEAAEDGKVIHARIFLNYLDQHTDDDVYVNKAMSTTLYELNIVDKGLGRSDLGIRPDIWNTTTGDMYEIKPVEQGAHTAKAQLITYILMANKFGKSDVHAGNSDDPGTNGSFWLGKKFVRYWSPEPGVILYSKTIMNKPKLNPNCNAEMEQNPGLWALMIFFGIILLPTGAFS